MHHIPGLTSSAGCPKGYKNPDNKIGYCVKLHSKRKKFSDAQKECQKDGASLMQMRTKAENDIMSKALAIFGQKYAWMDLTVGTCGTIYTMSLPQMLKTFMIFSK